MLKTIPQPTQMREAQSKLIRPAGRIYLIAALASTAAVFTIPVIASNLLRTTDKPGEKLIIVGTGVAAWALSIYCAGKSIWNSLEKNERQKSLE